MKTSKIQILGEKLVKQMLKQKAAQIKKEEKTLLKLRELESRIEDFKITHQLLH